MSGIYGEADTDLGGSEVDKMDRNLAQTRDPGCRGNRVSIGENRTR